MCLQMYSFIWMDLDILSLKYLELMLLLMNRNFITRYTTPGLSYSLSTLSFWSSLWCRTAAMFHCLQTLPLNRIIFHHWVTTALSPETLSSDPLFSH